MKKGYIFSFMASNCTQWKTWSSESNGLINKLKFPQHWLYVYTISALMTGCHLHNFLFIVLSPSLLRLLSSKWDTLSHFATQKHKSGLQWYWQLYYIDPNCVSTRPWRISYDYLLYNLVFFTSSYTGFFEILLTSIFLTWIGLQNKIQWK